MIKAYRNLNAPKGAIEWSIKPKHGESKGKVECYADTVVLGAVAFKVQPAGAERIKRRQQREVVAWVEGEAMGVNVVRERLNGGYQWDAAEAMSNGVRVTYRALMGDHYFRDAETGAEITGAEMVVCNPDGSCYALGVTYREGV